MKSPDRAAGTFPAPAPAGVGLLGAGYARNVPNVSGLDCGRSGRRVGMNHWRPGSAAAPGLGQSQRCPTPGSRGSKQQREMGSRGGSRDVEAAAVCGHLAAQRCCVHGFVFLSCPWEIRQQKIYPKSHQEAPQGVAQPDGAQAGAHPAPHPGGLGWEIAAPGFAEPQESLLGAGGCFISPPCTP